MFNTLKQAIEAYEKTDAEWFSIIAFKGAVQLRVPFEWLEKNKSLMQRATIETNKSGYGYVIKEGAGEVRAFKYIQPDKEAQVIEDIALNIKELESEWYLPDSVKWMMLDSWSEVIREKLRYTGQDPDRYDDLIARVKEAINYVE